MKKTAFWYMTPCSQVERNRCFGEKFCFVGQGNSNAVTVPKILEMERGLVLANGEYSVKILIEDLLEFAEINLSKPNGYIKYHQV
jgi:hypothetical protein